MAAINAGQHRASIATRDLKRWLSKTGLPYHSPHKFRHGHAVYALKFAQSVAALKAVSQNLMHENLQTTDGVYGILSETDVKKQIAELGTTLISSEAKDISMLISLTKDILKNLEKNPNSYSGL